jgi:hypothetical protein
MDRDPRALQCELSKMADRVCQLILSSDWPDVDVAIEKEKVRAFCEESFPDRMELYEMIYESRFQRLWDQWRDAAAEL